MTFSALIQVATMEALLSVLTVIAITALTEFLARGH